MNKDLFLLNEFLKALQQNANDVVVNLDDKFRPKFNFFIQRYETILEAVGTRVAPHKWSYYRIGLIKCGGADFTCGIYKFKAKKNTLVFIPSRIVNASSWDPQTTGYLVVFNLDYFAQNHFPQRYVDNKRTLQSTVRPYIYLTDAQADSVEEIYKTMLVENQTTELYKNELIAVKLVELLVMAERLYTEIRQEETDSAPLDVVRQFTELVETHFVHERSVRFYAEKLHIHPNYLNSLIKTHTGLTAKESIQTRVLLESKFLLHTTNLSIKQIAEKMGFEDPNYFTSFFKKHENLSPAAYRDSFL